MRQECCSDARRHVRPCLDVVFRALAGQLVIPDFAPFGRTCETVLGRCRRAPEAVAVCTVDGQQWGHGDVTGDACLQELAHCVTYLIARDQLGREDIHSLIGAVLCMSCDA